MIFVPGKTAFAPWDCLPLSRQNLDMALELRTKTGLLDLDDYLNSGECEEFDQECEAPAPDLAGNGLLRDSSGAAESLLQPEENRVPLLQSPFCNELLRRRYGSHTMSWKQADPIDEYAGTSVEVHHLLF